MAYDHSVDDSKRLACWMDKKWRAIDDEDALYDAVCTSAGCEGRVYFNSATQEIVLCDGGDMVLWSGRVVERPEDTVHIQQNLKQAAEKAAG